MADRIDITSVRLAGEPRDTSRATLILNDVGLSWGLEIVSDDPVVGGYLGGNELEVEFEAPDGVLFGEAKVLRAPGPFQPFALEMFGNSDLMKAIEPVEAADEPAGEAPSDTEAPEGEAVEDPEKPKRPGEVYLTQYV
jgi:hypothetical protein